MEPVLTATLIVAFFCAALLVVDVVVAFVRWLTTARWSLTTAKLGASLACSIVLLGGLVRTAPAGAATPPPTERLTGQVAPSASEHRDALAAAATETYTVERGDSLWAIAKHHLLERGESTDGSTITVFWNVIYDANRAVIGDDPNLIHPGQVLTIPGA